MRVTVDAEVCQGHARCWELCPEVFNLDDEGHGEVLVEVVPVELESQARHAAANCPEQAISVVD
jgi:ferredoxin